MTNARQWADNYHTALLARLEAEEADGWSTVTEITPPAPVLVDFVLVRPARWEGVRYHRPIWKRVA